MTDIKAPASANEESLLRVFTIPETSESTLSLIEKEISENLNGFLEQQIVAMQKPIGQVEEDFNSSVIPEEPMWVSDYGDQMLQKLISHSVHTSSPGFIGHMTSAMPYFLLPLAKLMVGLNQNVVKVETSKAFTPMERQVVGMFHHLVYQESPAFYEAWMHNAGASLGAFGSGGTVANITALWAARNRCFGPDGDFQGVAQEGMCAALKHYGYDNTVVLTSKRGHYSLSKTADILGIGRNSFIAIDVDAHNKIDIAKLRQKCTELTAKNIRILAIVGIAGTTETGNIDPLEDMASIAQEFNTHFHVDAAWGGATLLSNNYRHLLKGIEHAESVTIDAHKQFYIPIGAGLVIFKNPQLSDSIEHHAQYILREGSKDIGIHTLEGSRPGMAMLVHASLNIIGRQGYELLIDRSIEKAKYFAEQINAHPDFELVSEPELCLLTYRYVPQAIQSKLLNCTEQDRQAINNILNELTQNIQKNQRENGKTFVSRTQLTPEKYQGDTVIVFRVVLANPLTSYDILRHILDEQCQLACQQLTLLKNLQFIGH